MVVGDIVSAATTTKTQSRRIDGNFDCHGNAAVQCGVHRLMEHIWGFIRSHWMPPSVECLHRITPAASMVKEFKPNTQNTNKTQLLASNYGTFRSVVVCENFNPKMDPLESSGNRLKKQIRLCPTLLACQMKLITPSICL